MSELFTKTRKTPPSDEESLNAMFLIQGGFVEKLMAGAYTFLPMGLMVLNKIENIVREEINAVGGQEMLMPALNPKENWAKTGRWDSFDALFRLKSRFGNEYALGPTHEEILYPLLKNHISSYRDLPVYPYQIQTKFRDEPRAKSGLIRGKEFRMKDFYSFHETEEERNKFYETVKEAYVKIFKKLGLPAIPTSASGGTFSDASLEFQVITPAGEDTIFFCKKCGLAINKELILRRPMSDRTSDIHSQVCKNCGNELSEERAVEAGNIFPLKDKYAKDFNLTFKDKNGKEKFVSAGCYGLGTTRAMGTIVEVSHDEKGIIWPEAVAPFSVHLIEIKGDLPAVKEGAEKIYESLVAEKIEVLYDERADKSAGEKFADADLIGSPFRVVASEKTLKEASVEIKRRNSAKTELVKISKLISYVQ